MQKIKVIRSDIETYIDIDKSDFDSVFNYLDHYGYECAVDQMSKKNLESNQYHTIDRHDDHHRIHGMVWPHQILIPDNCDLNNLKYFIICVGGSIIWKLPISIIIKLFPPMKTKAINNDSKYCINIPKSYIFNTFKLWEVKGFNFDKVNLIPNKYVDMINKHKLQGLPLFLFEYHYTEFKLVTTDSIKYDLNFETVYFCSDIRDLFLKYPHGTECHVNLTHEIIVDLRLPTVDDNSKFKCCTNVKMYFLDNSFADLQYFVAYISKNQHFGNSYIDINKELKKIRTKYIEDGSKMITPLCQIIAEYTDNSHSGSCAIYRSEIKELKLCLYMKNDFRSMSGLGGLNLMHCHQSKKNAID